MILKKKVKEVLKREEKKMLNWPKRKQGLKMKLEMQQTVKEKKMG
jgi:hypothetical protein